MEQQEISKPLASFLLTHNPTAAGYQPRLATRVRTSRVAKSANPKMSMLEPLKGPLQSYSDIWVPFFKTAQESGLAPDWLIHWGHPAAMGTVLLTMGTFGAYLGWQTRLGNGGESNLLTLGDKVREFHPKLMLGACFFFFLGGQGGIVLSAVQGRSILESTHATTAFLGLGLLLVQAILPKLFDKTSIARDVHAYLGSATMLLLYFHMAAGLNLGFSF
jgi:hypothetical protein